MKKYTPKYNLNQLVSATPKEKQPQSSVYKWEHTFIQTKRNFNEYFNVWHLFTNKELTLLTLEQLEEGVGGISYVVEGNLVYIAPSVELIFSNGEKVVKYFKSTEVLDAYLEYIVEAGKLREI